MKAKKITVLLVLLALFVSFVPFGKQVKAGEEYGLVKTEKGEMYRDTHGNLYPVITQPNGEKGVVLNKYEIAPLKALLTRDSKISKGESALPEEILKQYYASKNSSTSASSYETLPAIYSYKQKYWKWGSKILGFGPDTIGQSGCFLTSSAMMLATYGLTINDSTVDPLNLSTWMKEHGGFNGDSLIFGVIANFPGIRDVGYFEHCSDAAIAIYYHLVPIIAVHHPGLHFCVLVKTDGEQSTATNWIVNTYDAIHGTSSYYAPERMYYTPYDNISGFSDYYYSMLQQARYNFADSNIFRTAYPQ